MILSLERTKEGSSIHRILESALRHFLRHGFRKTSVEEIARGAELSRQAVYRHFESKDEIYQETVNFMLSRNLEFVDAALADSGGVRERVLRAFEIWHLPYLEGPGREHIGELYDQMMMKAGDTAWRAAELFRSRVAQTIAEASAPPVDPATFENRVEVIYLTSKGLQRMGYAPSDYTRVMTEAIDLVCASATDDADPSS